MGHCFSDTQYDLHQTFIYILFSPKKRHRTADNDGNISLVRIVSLKGGFSLHVTHLCKVKQVNRSPLGSHIHHI